MKNSILFLLIVFSSIKNYAQKEIKVIHQNWKFSCNDSAVFRNASVPGSVFTDLIHHNIISDPYLKANEKESRWVSAQTWTYTVDFDIDNSILKNYKFAEICFEGIDTYAEVFLNDSLILSCNNAFRPWKKEVKSLLKVKKNKLKLIFPPIEEILKNESKKYHFTLPEGLRVFARKPQFHFGWDWAPKILDISIYKPVYIQFWNGFILDQIVIHSSTFNSENGLINASVYTRANSTNNTNFKFTIKDANSGIILFSKNIATLKDEPFRLEVPIKKIKQWSIENPIYYDLIFTLKHSEFGEQSIQKRIGFRTVSLKQPKDSIGSEFYFELNGNKIFSKGTNWVPMDVFRHRITEDNYRKLLILAKDAGFNMIRVWGGGYYEDESFYNLCDSLGILVWQDFMFACSMYPFDEKFVNSVKEESIFQLQRLSNHPSIAVWCGNNENTEGWFNWGWQKEFAYSNDDSLNIWEGNYDIFYKKMPEWCSLNNLDRDYHPSSPAHGWGRKEAYTQGDVHYWGVWWGYEAFEKYFEKVGRFVSEYGFQGYPHISTLEYMMQGKIDSLLHPHIQQHQKHPRGQQTIDTYMLRDFEMPTNAEDYVYISQMLQSEGVGKAIIAHRLAMPYCMGTLFWQFNDCWPSISWSAIDYFYQPKAFYYKSKQLFQDIAPIIVQRNDSILFYVSNLQSSNCLGKIIIGQYFSENAICKYDTLMIDVPSRSNSLIYFVKVDTNVVYGMQLIDKKNKVVGHYTHFCKKNIIAKLPHPKISTIIPSEFEVSDVNNYSIMISADVPVYGVWINVPDAQLFDNGFHLFPGFVYKIEAKPLLGKKSMDISNIKFKNLNTLLPLSIKHYNK